MNRFIESRSLFMDQGLKFNLNARVAIVDDQSSIGKELIMILQKIGFTNIKFFLDGKTAWDNFRLEAQYGDPFEVVFLDINMPGMSGIELLKNLRNTQTYKSIPIFMVTTESEKSTVIICISLGATDYIVKPYKMETVIEKIKAKLETTGSI